MCGSVDGPAPPTITLSMVSTEICILAEDQTGLSVLDGNIDESFGWIAHR